MQKEKKREKMGYSLLCVLYVLDMYNFHLCSHLHCNKSKFAKRVKSKKSSVSQRNVNVIQNWHYFVFRGLEFQALWSFIGQEGTTAQNFTTLEFT